MEGTEWLEKGWYGTSYTYRHISKENLTRKGEKSEN